MKPRLLGHKQSAAAIAAALDRVSGTLDALGFGPPNSSKWGNPRTLETRLGPLEAHAIAPSGWGDKPPRGRDDGCAGVWIAARFLAVGGYARPMPHWIGFSGKANCHDVTEQGLALWTAHIRDTLRDRAA